MARCCGKTPSSARIMDSFYPITLWANLKADLPERRTRWKLGEVSKDTQRKKRQRLRFASTGREAHEQRSISSAIPLSKEDYDAIAQRIYRGNKKVTVAEAQQERLFRIDDRRCQLEKLWKARAETRARRRSKKTTQTYSDQLSSEVGLYILEEGRPADRTMYTLVDLKGLEKVLLSREWVEKPSLMVLRDSNWYKRRSSRTTSDRFVGTLPTGKLDVQDLGRLASDSLERRMNVEEFRQRWKQLQGTISNKALNLLNIACNNSEDTPPPLLELCNFLHGLVEEVKTIAFSEGNALVGKPFREAIRDTSLEGCLRFQIFGLAGAISGWHMDLLAPITWITLEGNDEEGADDSVLKYWAVVDMSGSDLEEREKLLAEFATFGPTWKPPSELIRIISLVRGDTLIMPPGTIHAPITVTNCLFRGGMCWDKRIFVARTLPNWQFILKHRHRVTNEDPQTQTSAILDVVKRDIRIHPGQYGLYSEDETEAALGLCESIATLSAPCTCSGPCGISCLCTIHQGAEKIRHCFRGCSCSCLK